MILKFFQCTNIPDEIYENQPSKARARDFYISRKALKSALCELDEKYHNSDLEELKIVDHHYLESDSNIKVSLSHTGDYGAAIVSTRANISSIGVDIELLTRKHKSGMEKYIDHHLDDSLPFLEKWTMKEACFKAAWPIYHHQKENSLVLKDIWIKENKFGIFSSEEPIGEINLNEMEIFDEEFLVATAII